MALSVNQNVSVVKRKLDKYTCNQLEEVEDPNRICCSICHEYVNLAYEDPHYHIEQEMMDQNINQESTIPTGSNDVKGSIKMIKEEVTSSSEPVDPEMVKLEVKVELNEIDEEEANVGHDEDINTEHKVLSYDNDFSYSEQNNSLMQIKEQPVDDGTESNDPEPNLTPFEDHNAASCSYAENERSRWTYEETLAFISRAEEHIHPLSDPKLRNAGFTNIANEMENCGYVGFTTAKCKLKWQNLLRGYKLSKELKNRTGQGPIRFHFYDIIDNIMKDKWHLFFKSNPDNSSIQEPELYEELTRDTTDDEEPSPSPKRRRTEDYSALFKMKKEEYKRREERFQAKMELEREKLELLKKLLEEVKKT